MGELILCNQEMAAMPYYLDSISLNVYSIEEICYYIEKNLYLLDTGFMDIELCNWFEQELKEKALAEKLREVIFANGSLSEFVALILQNSSYCSLEAKRQIMTVLNEMQNKSSFECGKIRADRLMENKRYYHAIMEYRRLLLQEEERKQQQELSGNILHNLGVAYARLFLFSDAAECFLSAYSLNQQKESLIEAMAAFRCGRDANGLEEVQKAYNISAEEMSRLTQSWSEISRNERIQEFEQQLDEMFSGAFGETEASEKVLSVLLDWETEYKKNCGM